MTTIPTNKNNSKTAKIASNINMATMESGFKGINIKFIKKNAIKNDIAIQLSIISYVSSLFITIITTCQ